MSPRLRNSILPLLQRSPAATPAASWGFDADLHPRGLTRGSISSFVRWIAGSTPAMTMSELYAISAFETQHRARLLGRCDVISKLLDEPAHLRHLLGVALRKLAPADVEAVLQPHTHVAAHHHRLCGERNLNTAGAQDGPAVCVPEQLVGRALHEHQIVDVTADAAENAEDQLQENGRLE